MHSVKVDISTKALTTQDTIHRPHKVQEEERPKYGYLGSSEKGDKIFTGANMQIKCRAETEGKAIQRLSRLDAKKCLLKGTWYGCLLRGPARALQIQTCNECRVPNGGVRERTEGAEGLCNSMGRTTISTNQTSQSYQGLSHQPKSTHGGAHGSSRICSRE